MSSVDSIIPVDPSALYLAAHSYTKRGRDFESLMFSVRTLPEIAPSWSGESALAFQERVWDLTRLFDRYGQAFAQAGRILDEAADAFQECRLLAGDLLARRALCSPGEAVSIDTDLRRLRASGEGLASEFATRLLDLAEIFGIESEKPESDNSNLAPLGLTQEQNLALLELWLSDGAFGDDALVQGQIGDCFVIATLISMMSTEEGSDFLRRSIRPKLNPFAEDPIQWEVRLYGDDTWWNPFDQDPEEWETVTKRYRSSVKGADQFETLAWLFERAYGQKIGHDDLADGGSRFHAMEDLTGMPPTKVMGPSVSDTSSQEYTPEERQEIIQAIEDRRPVTTGTGNTTKTPEYWDQYKTTKGKVIYESYAPVQLEGKGGKEATIKIYGSHAYAIVGADEEGLTLVNPHDRNHLEGGRAYEDSGKFYITWDEFDDRFGDVTIGGEYRK